MNKDNAAQFLPLVQAMVEGKVIQYRYFDKWVQIYDLAFQGSPENYRIKLEPEVFFMVGTSGSTWGKYPTLDKAREVLKSRRARTTSFDAKIYKCVEVIE